MIQQQGHDYEESVKKSLIARPREYRLACRLLNNKIDESSKIGNAFYRSSDNLVRINMTCAKTNKCGQGATMLHEHGHALDYAIGVKLGYGKEISEVMNFGETVCNSLKYSLGHEAATFIKSHKEIYGNSFSMEKVYTLLR